MVYLSTHPCGNRARCQATSLIEQCDNHTIPVLGVFNYSYYLYFIYNAQSSAVCPVVFRRSLFLGKKLIWPVLTEANCNICPSFWRTVFVSISHWIISRDFSTMVQYGEVCKSRECEREFIGSDLCLLSQVRDAGFRCTSGWHWSSTASAWNYQWVVLEKHSWTAIVIVAVFDSPFSYNSQDFLADTAQMISPQMSL